MFSALRSRNWFRKGCALLSKEHNFSKALRLLGKAAHSGNMDAQFRLGLLYLRGQLVPSSRSNAVYWLEKAATAGCAEAQCLLANLYIGGDFALGTDALTTRGFFSRPTKLEANFDKAFYWSRKAADQGSAEGLALIGFLHSDGPEEYRDSSTARLFYERAANAGCLKGYLGLAILELRGGELSAERCSVAKALLLKASQENEPLSHYYLGIIAQFENHLVHAIQELRKAAQGGVVDAQLRLGLLMVSGPKSHQNLFEGEGWLRRAGNSGSAVAAATMGDIYSREEELPPNYAEAIGWYEKAATLGHSLSARKLGLVFFGRNGSQPELVAIRRVDGMCSQARKQGRDQGLRNHPAVRTLDVFLTTSGVECAPQVCRRR